MAQNTRKLVGVILMLAMLVAAIAALTVTASAAEESETLSIIANKGSLASDNSSISWTSGDATVTNLKSASTSAIRTSDSDHFRAYANSALSFSVASGNIKTIVVTCTSGSYATALVDSVGSEAKASGSVVTITPSTLDDVYSIAKLGAQVRFKQVVITYEVADGACQHTDTTETTVPASCTEAGSTTVTCNVCGYTVSATPIPALGHTGGTATCEKLAVCDTCGNEYGNLAAHNYVNNVCTECGAEVPSEATIDFSTTSQRLSWTAEIQVWQNGALKVTNNKASSTSNIIDSSNPVRFYKSSNVVIEFPGMTEIVVVCDTAAYATALYNSIDTTTATASVDGTTVTITLNAASDSYTISLSGGQVRVDSITASAPKAGECVHEWDEGAVTTEPTCTVAGVMTYTCTKCGDEKEATIDKAAHNYADTNWCSACNYPKPGIALSIPEAKSLAEYLNGADSGNDKYYMTVFITDVYNTQYGNMNVTDNMGNTFVIYGTYDGNGNRYDAMENAPVAGDLITVYGKIGSYQGTAQMMYADITAVHTVETSDYVEFLGAGIRYLDAEGNTVSTDTVALRFGYQLSDDVLAWGWEFTAGSKAGSMTGENKTADGISNLLFTNIAPENFNTDINVRIWYNIKVGGSIVTIYDEVWNARSVAEVVVKTSQNAADAANAYATQLVATHNITWTPKEEESTLPEEN